ncbi:MAG: glutamate--tRNA ligase, partial [Polyangiales bacterium]
RDEVVFDDKAKTKFLVPSAAPNLREMADIVEKLEPFTEAAIEAAFTAWLEKKGLQIKDVAQAARVAVSGRSVSPGIYETFFVLGQAETVKRLRDGAARAEGT